MRNRAKSTQGGNLPTGDDLESAALFTIRDYENGKIITLPHNIASHDSVILCKLVDMAITRGYRLAILEGKNLTTFKSKKSVDAWVCGFIDEKLSPSTEMPTGDSSYMKGRRSVVIDAARKGATAEQLEFLRKNVDTQTLGHQLAQIEMNNAQYSVRANLQGLLNRLESEQRVSSKQCLRSYQQVSKQLFKPDIHTNSGVFSSSEIRFMAKVGENVEGARSRIEEAIKTSSCTAQELVMLKIELDKCKKTYKEKLEPTSNFRKKYLFPTGDRKADKEFKKLSLVDKLARFGAIKTAQVMNPSRLVKRTVPVPTTIPLVLAEKSKWNNDLDACADLVSREEGYNASEIVVEYGQLIYNATTEDDRDDFEGRNQGLFNWNYESTRSQSNANAQRSSQGRGKGKGRGGPSQNMHNQFGALEEGEEDY
jgi:hypothetical protein